MPSRWKYQHKRACAEWLNPNWPPTPPDGTSVAGCAMSRPRRAVPEYRDGMTRTEPSAPARVAAPGEGITAQELQLAARNHGMPAEALRYDLTPVGLHYLLIHYDIPDLGRSTWRLRVGGAVRRPVELTLDDLRRRPRVTTTVTLECAGNGRARLEPRPVRPPGRAPRWRPCWPRRASRRVPSRWRSPGRTTGSSAGWSRTTPGRCRWPRRSARTCCSRTR